jgi:hypothetical protein
MPSSLVIARRALCAAILCAASAAAAQEPYAQQVADAIPRIEAATGLHFKRPPRFEMRTRGQMRELLARMLAADSASLAGEQAVYRRLGIIADTLDWRALQLGMLTEQVVGIYDPSTKLLYIESDAEEQALGIVITHELVHALQDQYVDLDSIEHLRDDDRVRAAEAALEGQATLISFELALGFGPEFPGGAEAIRQSVGEERAEQPVTGGAPRFAQELQIFPYLGGLDFMVRFQRERADSLLFGGGLPVSTAQILHPNAYFAVPRREPVAVSLPPAAGVTPLYENVMGELATRAFLQQTLRDRKRAIRTADGWAGDRFALVRAGSDSGVVWLSVWETPRDAGEFADAMRRVAKGRYKKPDLRTIGDTTIFTAGARSVRVWSGTLDGRPAVLYEDLPTAFEPRSATLEVRDSSSQPRQ